MNLKLILAAAMCLAVAACSDRAAPDTEEAATDVTATTNPLLEDWDTPFGVPPFDRFSSDDYLPAMRASMEEHNAEVDAIVANTDAPTFGNTIEALERSGKSLGRVARIFYALDSAHSDDVIKETAKTIAPEFSAHNDNISLNKELFDRVLVVYEQRDDLELTGEQQRLLEETHKQFVRSGANLEDEAQDRLREINTELAELSQQFGDNVLDDTNNFELLVTDEADLGDLPASLVALAAEEAQRRGHECECWAFTLQRPSINPFLQYSPNRELRKQMFDGYAMRGDNDNEVDNKAIISRVVQLRAERSALMGYDSHAHFVLSDNMAETPDNVYGLLDQVWKPALAVAKAERADMQAMMSADGIEDRLRGWDWRYYTEKVRKAKFDLDEEALRPYFEVNAVRDGVFALATELFGLQFEQRDDLPVWHPEQQVFEVKEADGSHLAILYLDYFARESKRGGAWMNALRSQSNVDGFVTPIVTNNFNFPAPTGDSPSLLSLTEANTFFHEFGHALHGMFSNVTYESLSGTSTPRDFVEFPSQVMENWMRQPEVLRMFANHYETGEPIPQDVIDKITASATFNQGFETVEYMAAAYLDMAYHVLDTTEAVEPRSFENAAMADIGLIEEIIPRYRSGYFQHIFSGGYSSGYYSYMWSEILDADTFMAFQETSLFDQDTAARYREEILSKGGTRPGMELYRNFRGREPEIGPLLVKKGLN
ncbi:MAG: M3 family metallopeptidase [Gammaproteobacteria bacterium]|jgi:peptidyl-dipeptidase Dcp|nr:M3 family metallopeptidase [Gammaproteobacteria bacterium]MDH3804391.1 M3 family metallopeptidase [Gammaproteobacteria bacterium]